MAKDVFFENETEPIIDALLDKYKLEETPEQAAKKMAEEKYFSGGTILNAAKSVVLGEIDPQTLSSYLKQELDISDTEATNLSKDILEKLVTGAEVGDVPDEVEPAEPEITKQNIQIEEADRMPVMPTAEPLPETTTAPQTPQPQPGPKPVAAPTEEKPQPTRKRELPKKEVLAPTAPETAAPEPKIKMKRGPDSYREPIE